MPTYCNPINVDYGYCPIPNFCEQGKHRATADPVILTFRGDYYLFSTNQSGYWHSADMLDWTFVRRTFLRPEHDTYDDLCAPTAWVMNDAIYVIGSTYTDIFPIWVSKNPKANEWEEATSAFKPGGWDPAFFLDDDGRLYFYHGSGNTHPIFGFEVDPVTFEMIGERKPLVWLDDAKHGWERFGEHYDNVFLRPFIEGAWMDKHAGRYYLQYGAPGTEFRGYADDAWRVFSLAVVFEPIISPFIRQPCILSDRSLHRSRHFSTQSQILGDKLCRSCRRIWLRPSRCQRPIERRGTRP